MFALKAAKRELLRVEVCPSLPDLRKPWARVCKRLLVLAQPAQEALCVFEQAWLSTQWEDH